MSNFTAPYAEKSAEGKAPEGYKGEGVQEFHSGGPAPTQPLVAASLYVGDLADSVTEATLFELFNMVGPVSSIRVCRDSTTRKSLGYAYVNYMHYSDALVAIENLNYAIIKEKPCRVSLSQRDPSLRKSGEGNIYIKNLDKSIGNKELHDTFSAFGEILSCKIATTESNESKGYGFVQFKDPQAAKNAIKKVNQMQIGDNIVTVVQHVSKKDRASKADEINNVFTNLYIKDLDLSVTEQELEEYFGKCGTITSSSISRDSEGKSKGFAFVNYQTHEQAVKAIEEFNCSTFKGNKIYVGRAQTKVERAEELSKKFEELKLENDNKVAKSNLYVKNIDEQACDTDEKLRELFDKFGVITSCKIMRDDKNVSKGFGFVCFDSPENANKAIMEMNGKMLGSKPLYVAIAQRKEDRRTQLEEQATHRNQIRMHNNPHAFAMMGNMPPGYPNQMFMPNQFMQPRMGVMPGFPPHVSGSIGQRPGFAPRQPSFPNTSFMARPHVLHNKLAPDQFGAGKDFRSLSSEQRRQKFGERVFVEAQIVYGPSIASKIAGMILDSSDLDAQEEIMGSKKTMDEKINEAAKALLTSQQ